MLIGKQIRLRAVEREDLPRFVTWMNAPETRRFLLRDRPMSLAEEIAWFEALNAAKDKVVYIAEARIGATPEARDETTPWRPIGSTGLHDIDWKNRNADFGILVGEPALWGKGFGRDIARTMLRFAFDELNLHRIELDVFSFNPRARRCYERIGFRVDGTRREALFREGAYHDVVMMSVLRGELRNEDE